VQLPQGVARAGLRPAREGTQHQALVPVLLKAAGLSVSGVQLSAAELQAMAREALAKGDAARGEHFYRRSELACVACHAIGGAGGKLGPDLTSIGASAPPDYLVEALLYPNAKIKEGYHSVLLSTSDGQEHNGMITRVSDDLKSAQAIASSRRSSPQNNSLPTTKDGAPKMPRSMARAVWALSASLFSGEFASCKTCAASSPRVPRAVRRLSSVPMRHPSVQCRRNASSVKRWHQPSCLPARATRAAGSEFTG